MPLSTSNFERLLPAMPWLKIFGVSLFVFFTFASLMEIRLAQLGYRPTVQDSKEKWLKERGRASQLGARALILVGASRIQLGIDLDTLRRESGLEPVQLALDASSFVPILKGLADDPEVRGTILVDYSPGVVEGTLSSEYGGITALETEYGKRAGNHEFSLTHMERLLAEILHENLRSFADGATPLMSLQLRIIPEQRARQYLTTLTDRSRLADYRLIPMPEFYYQRVIRNMGEEQSINPSDPDIEQILRRKINLLHPHNNTSFIQGAKYLSSLVTKISAHGGKVVFVEMPTSGMVREIDDKRYPRANFLDVFEKEVGVPVLNSTVNQALQSFTCPDGSHLDYRDRSRFTAALAHSLGISR